MPKLTSAVPKYRKHRASGRAVVTIHGIDHYLGPHNSAASKAEYDRLIAEYLASGRRTVAPGADGRRLTVTELIAAYWKFCQGYYRKAGKPTSEQSVIKLALRDLKRLYGRLPANEFGPLKLKALREHWIGRGHARKTINDQVGRLKRMYRWAVAEELVPGACYQELSAVAGLAAGRTEARESAPIRPVEIGVVERTIPHLSAVVADMVRLQMLTGARPAEVCRLTPGAVDRSNEVWEYRVDGHKTEHHGRCRIVFIGPTAQKILAPYLLRGQGAPCFSPAEAAEQVRQRREANRTTPLSCGNRRGSNRKAKPRRTPGDHYTTAAYGRAIARACDSAFPPPDDLPEDQIDAWRKKNRWAPNRLRHTAATEIRRRFGLEAAQVILGHAAANVTEVYAERDAEKARAVAKQIG